MKIKITNIGCEEVDVTTRDFPGISEGKRDMLKTHFNIDFKINLPSMSLHGNCRPIWDKNLTIDQLEKMIYDKLIEELK
jgi:hypothetical protein